MVIADMTLNQTTVTYRSEDKRQIMETDAYIIPFSPNLDPRQVNDIPTDPCTKMIIVERLFALGY